MTEQAGSAAGLADMLASGAGLHYGNVLVFAGRNRLRWRQPLGNDDAIGRALPLG